MKFLSILVCCTFLFAEKYNIYLWSIPVAQVEMINNPGEVHFKTKSIGLVNYIWPYKNSYSTVYNTDNFGLRKYSKNIKQGDLRKSLLGSII